MSNTAPALPGNVEADARATVSRNIRVAMAKRGVDSPGDLATILDVDRRWVTRRLANEFDYTLTDLVRIARGLEVTVDTLVAGVEA